MASKPSEKRGPGVKPNSVSTKLPQFAVHTSLAFTVRTPYTHTHTHTHTHAHTLIPSATTMFQLEIRKSQLTKVKGKPSG